MRNDHQHPHSLAIKIVGGIEKNSLGYILYLFWTNLL